MAAVTLLLLTIAPVYAAPSLSLGSRASYDFNGRVKVDQSCTTDNLAYASQACNGFSSVTFPTYVRIFDHNNCSTTGDPLCSFNPPSVYVTQGDTVVWQNFGNATHAAIANMTLNVGLPPFDTGPIAPGGSSSYSFAQTGSYHYYDPSYKWMTGIVYVNPAPSPPQAPKPTSSQVDLNGSIGWTVVGLSSDQVNLNVAHKIGISVLVFTPVTESGSFEQSINLSTRVESPGTATSIVKSLLTSLLTGLSGAALSTGVTSPALQTMLSAQSNSPDYTMWWVNGPLSNGSPVQILHGWSSVTGSEDLNLGTSIGTRSSWIVTSQLSQTLNVTIPNPTNPLSPPATSQAAASLRLLWSYDKSSDLLLRNDNTLTVATRSVTPETIYTSCGQFGCTPISLTVTRNTALTFNLALLLSSTNLRQLSAPPSQASTLMNLLSALPWMPLGIAGLAAVVAAGLILWFTRRTKGQTMPAPSPTTSPAPPSTTPS